MRLRFVIASFVASLSLFAEVITPEAALSRLNSSNSSLKPFSTGVNANFRNVYTGTASDGKAAYYVFDKTEGMSTDGYVILAADDIAAPLLGVVESGNFDYNSAPTNMQWFLNYLSEEIASARALRPVPMAIPDDRPPTRPNRATINPLLTTRWNQGAPFYNQCPTSGGSRCVTGCVATALAQVMNYHEWPATGLGSHSYTTETLGLSVSMNFANTTFDWNNMLDQYVSNSWTSAQATAVATLMKACGVAVEMDYTPQASGAYSEGIPSALLSYFDYDPDIRIAYRSDFGLNDWETMLYNNLQDVGPVYLSGSCSDGGHAFVTDGYQGDGLFHLNWGWGGLSDGWFRITGLDPDQQGIGGSTAGYNMYLTAILGIQRPTGTDHVTPFMVCKNFGISQTSSTQGGDITMKTDLISHMAGTHSVAPGIKFTNTSTSTDYYGGGTSYEELGLNEGWTTFTTKVPTSMPNGTYRVRPAFKMNGNWYDMHCGITGSEYVNATVSGNSVTFSTPSAVKLPQITPTLPDVIFKGKSFDTVISIAGSQNSEIVGSIVMVLMNNASIGIAGQGPWVAIDIPQGETEEFTYSASLDVDPGTYPAMFYFTDGYNSSYVSEYFYVTISSFTAGTPSVTSVNAPEIYINDPTLRLEVDVTVTGGQYANKVLLLMGTEASLNDGSYGYYYSTNTLNIANGSIATACFEIPIENPSLNTRYFYAPYLVSTSNEWEQDGYYTFTINEATGIGGIAAEETPVEVEYFTTDGICVGSKAERKGLYIRKSRMADGSCRMDKVIVR